MTNQVQSWSDIVAADMATYPPVDHIVRAQVRHCTTKSVVAVLLVHVSEDDVSWRTADDLSELSYDWDVVAWQDARLSTEARAPTAEWQRKRLEKDVTNLPAAAARKGHVLTARDHAHELAAGRLHFELGCWLHFYLQYIRRAGATQARFDCARRIFLAGFSRLDNSFFTAFDFGEREFDSLFEGEDAEAVISALRQLIPTDGTGNIATAFTHLGWPIDLH